MHADFELALRDLLLAHKDSRVVAEKILKRMQSESLNRSEKKTFLAFLINCGFYKEAYLLFADWFREKKRIPIRSMLSILYLSGFKPGRDFLKYLFEAQAELDEKDKLLTFAPWEEASSQIAQLRSQLIRELEENQVRERREAFDKLEYLKEQRMIHEEDRLLQTMRQRYPNDSEVERRENEFKERWARHLLNEKSLESKQNDLFQKSQKLTLDEMKWADSLIEVLEKKIKKYPKQAYNLSISLYFMELFDHALILLRNAEPTDAVLWFRLELLFRARRFIDCLDGLSAIDQALADNPETTFATTYLRAQVLKGLGQTGKAIELLKSLVAIRPNYRSAHSLLLEWSGGSSQI